MRRRALSLAPRLLWHRLKRGRFVDILIAHAPAKGIHDSPVGAHRGFETFLQMVKWFKPRLFLHGHNHRYGLHEWHTCYGETHVVNVHPFCMIDIEADQLTVSRPRP